jgi:hypothetical protein
MTPPPPSRRLVALLGVALLGGPAACGESDDDADTGADTTGGTTDDPSSTMTTTMNPSTTVDPTMDPSTTMNPATTDDPSTTDDPTTTGDPTEAPTTTDPDTTTGDPVGYDFADDPYEAYTQIDRHGAVEAGTAGIAAPEGLGFNPGSDISIRDDYNASNPAEDAAGMWLPEIGASVTFFHAALDDDLQSLGMMPATVDQTVAQAGPVIVPDTIKYDPSLPTAYPNGRRLEDPVVDITLAAVLLDLQVHPLSLFAGLPLNPPANDVPFGKEFPYLAPPHPAK